MFPEITFNGGILLIIASCVLDLIVTSTVVFLFRLKKAYKNGFLDVTESRKTPSGSGWANDAYNGLLRLNYNSGIRQGLKKIPDLNKQYAIADSRAGAILN
jgi:hypothetical protein